MAVTPLNAANLTSPPVWQDNPYAVIDAAAYGAIGNNTLDQSTPLTNAIAAASTFISTYGARGATVYIPPGRYRLTNTISLPAGVSLVGAGMDATQLYWPTELDGGATWAVWAITLADTNNDPRNFVTDMHLNGPGTSHTMGTKPANMHGLKMGSHGRAERVRVEHFNRGINGFADHGTLRDCIVTNNFDGFYLGPSPNQIGDWTFDECDFTGNTRSGIGVSRGTSMEGSTFLSSHTGFSPYGILQDNLVETTPVATGTPNKFLMGNTFLDMAFESYGNAAIATADLTQAGSVQFNTFINATSAGELNATYQFATDAHDSVVRVNSFSRNTVVHNGSGNNPFLVAGTYACVKVQASATNNTFRDILTSTLVALTVPWAKSVTDGNVGDLDGNANAFFTDDDLKLLITPVSGTVTAQDLLERLDYRVRRATTRAIAGVAMSAPVVTGVDSVCFMAVSGPGVLVKPQVFAGQTVGTLIKADQVNNAKALTSATWASTEPIIGHYTGSSGGVSWIVQLYPKG